MALSILISDTDTAWSDEMQKFLESKDYEIDRANSGKNCQLKVYKQKFMAIILDVDTKAHSGFEVLKYIRLNAPLVNVILTFADRKRFKELELSKDELRKLGAADILIRPFTMEMLLQSLEGASQLESWKDIRKSSDETHDEEEVVVSDDEFTKIKVRDFYSGNTNIFDYYIRISQNKYVKIFHKGDVYEPQRLKKYAEATHLFFKTKDRAAYINFVNDVLGRLSAAPQVSLKRKFDTARNLTEKYVEEIYTVGFKPQLIEEGEKLCAHMSRMINDDKELSKLMKMYNEYENQAQAHAFLVSFLSVIICKNLEWATSRTTELIAFAALFHDIGKLQMKQKLDNIAVADMNEKQLEMYHSHPEMGIEMLQKYPAITEPVRQIVYQHHELINGEGFPNGLPGIRIYPLAKVVSLADEFANLMVREQVTPFEGLKKFIPNKERVDCFDAQSVRALVQGFLRKK